LVKPASFSADPLRELEAGAGGGGGGVVVGVVTVVWTVLP
jgi:hypothetical protein